MDLIECRGLGRTFSLGGEEIHAVRDLDLAVTAGEWVAVMGPSGSGKSTLLHLLGCLDRPDRGQYRLAGRLVSELDDDDLARARSEEIGFVFQSFHLLARATALENVALPLAYAGVPRASARDRAAGWLERVGLADRVDHRPHQLSGGQRQRVAIARALVNEPSLLLADEPTGNLDSATGTEILDLLADLHARGHTLIMVTHEADVAGRARRTIRMRDGRIESDLLAGS